METSHLEFAFCPVAGQSASPLSYETRQLHMGDGEADPGRLIKQPEQNCFVCQLHLAFCVFNERRNPSARY